MAVGMLWAIRKVAQWHLRTIQGLTPIIQCARRRSESQRGRHWFWGWETWILNPRPVLLTIFSSPALRVNTVRKKTWVSRVRKYLWLGEEEVECELTIVWVDLKRNLRSVNSLDTWGGYNCFVVWSDKGFLRRPSLGWTSGTLRFIPAGKTVKDVRHLAKTTTVHSLTWQLFNMSLSSRFFVKNCCHGACISSSRGVGQPKECHESEKENEGVLRWHWLALQCGVRTVSVDSQWDFCKVRTFEHTPEWSEE